MYERFIEQCWAIYAVLHDEQGSQSQNKHIHLKDERKLLEQLIVVLKLVLVTTTALCESDIFSGIPSHSWFAKKHLVTKTDDLQVIKAIKEKITYKILCHFTPESLEIVKEASLITLADDPDYHPLRHCHTDNVYLLMQLSKTMLQKCFHNMKRV